MQPDHIQHEECDSTDCAVADLDIIVSPPIDVTSVEVGTIANQDAVANVMHNHSMIVASGDSAVPPSRLAPDLPFSFTELSNIPSVVAPAAIDETIESIESRIGSALDLDTRFVQVRLVFAHQFGLLLLDYKNRVEHGNFTDRLRQNVLRPGRSMSTISDYMRIASVPLDELIDSPNSQRSGIPSIAGALEYIRDRDKGGPDGRTRQTRDRLPRAALTAPAPSDPTASGGNDQRDREAEDVGFAADRGLVLRSPVAQTANDCGVTPQSPSDVTVLACGEVEPHNHHEPRPGFTSEDRLAVTEALAESEPLTFSSSAAVGTSSDGDTAVAPTTIRQATPALPIATSLPGHAPGSSPSLDLSFAGTTSSDPEAALADDAWLAQLPIRSQLSQTKDFDREALAYRRHQPELLEIVGRARLGTDELAHIRPFPWVARGFRSRLAYVVGVNHPRDWKLCPRCKGQAKDILGDPCPDCRGACFEVTQSGDDLDQSAGADGTA